MSNSIGSLTFCFLRRNDERGATPELLVQQKSILRRLGTDGTSVRLEGKAGEPFRARSFRDFETRLDALAEIDSYKTMEDSTDLQTVTWESQDWEQLYEVKVAILRVSDFSVLRVREVSAPAVKLTTTPAYILQATWDLLPVAVEEA